MSEFKAYIETYKVELIFGSETFLNEDITDSMISNNHIIYRRDRNRHGGGVLLGIDKKYKTVLLDFFTDTFESITIQLFIYNKKFILSSLYIPPNPNKSVLDEFKQFFREINDKYSDNFVIIAGDCNIDFLNYDKQSTKYFSQIINELAFVQKVNSYTYPTDLKYSQTKSLLDVVIVNNEDIILDISVTDSISQTCDHFLIAFHINIEKIKPKILTKTYINYSNETDLERFRNAMTEVNWNSIFSQYNDINTIYNQMISEITKCQNNCFKPKLVKIKSKIPNRIKCLIKRKTKVFQLYKRNNDIFYYYYINHMYERIHELLTEYHSEKYDKLIQKSDNLKSFYKYIKNNSQNTNSNIFTDNKNNLIINESEICEQFSECFSSKYCGLSLPNYESLNEFQSNFQVMSEFIITKTDVLREIMNFKVNKSCLNSEIPTILIIKCPEIFTEILYQLFNLMLKVSEIPESLKTVTVIPIYKKGKPKGKIDSYRPVSIEKNFLKLFCKLIFNNISAFVCKNSVIPHNQYGFRPGMSTSTQLIDIFDYITDSFNDKSLVCVDIIFLDLKNAFDSITFKSILENCYLIGIRNKSLELLENYLLNRKQFISYNNVCSELKVITSGVPQGGIGSPELFNLTVREFPQILKFSKLFQYADDSCIVKRIFNMNDIIELQTDLNDVYNWCLNKNLQINSTKSVHLRISLKNCSNFENYFINDIKIPEKSDHKHLGFIIDSRLTFNNQINCIYNKCLQKWGFLRNLCRYANSNILLKIYKSYILPLIDYCSVCLVPNNIQIEKIEKIQRKITKYICYKMSKKVDYKERLKILNLCSLNTRRQINVLKIVFKCLDNYNEIPIRWRNKFIISQNVRNGRLIVRPKTRNYFCDKNLFCNSIDLFNALPKDIRNETNLKCFLTKCEKFYSF